MDKHVDGFDVGDRQQRFQGNSIPPIAYLGTILVTIFATDSLIRAQSPAAVGSAGNQLLLEETFSSGFGDWWVEGGENVWVEDGRLHVKADPASGRPGSVATVWYERTLPGDLQVQFDAHVVESTVKANNINFFFCYSHPSTETMFDTRDQRADAAYGKYHRLNGYIVTFLNDFGAEGGRYPDGTTKARFRMRRCPGFHLVDETFGYHCQPGRTYHVVITKRRGRLTCAVDGHKQLEWTDPEPLEGGMLGLRTFRTHLWWDNIRVKELSP